MRQLHPEAIAAIQSKALFSQAEEVLLAKILSSSQPKLEVFQELLIQPLPKGNQVLNFSDAEQLVDDAKLKESRDEVLEHEERDKTAGTGATTLAGPGGQHHSSRSPWAEPPRTSRSM
ncbi:microspherule protein 1-like isoform X2 [Salvelinus fontinalis]|nr:microspherule protein 1-like isoform X2 [Salvelinus fontinalis]